jgi:2-methylisocitrate lyase-like PEP mutase family enzyme
MLTPAGTHLDDSSSALSVGLVKLADKSFGKLSGNVARCVNVLAVDMDDDHSAVDCGFRRGGNVCRFEHLVLRISQHHAADSEGFVSANPTFKSPDFVGAA